LRYQLLRGVSPRFRAFRGTMCRYGRGTEATFAARRGISFGTVEILF